MNGTGHRPGLAGRATAYALVLAGALLMLAPFWFMFVFATHSRTEIFNLPPPWFFGGHFAANLQVLLPEGILETAGIATDDDQLPPFVSQARHEGTPHPASRTGDQRNLVHALSSMQRRNIPIVGQQLLTWTKYTTLRVV